MTPTPFRGREFAPIRLKALMVRLGVSNADLAGRVVQARGFPISRTAINQIINHAYFPRNSEPAVIRGQIEAALADHGATPEDLAVIWETDDRPPPFLGRPAGTGLGNRNAAHKHPAAEFEPLEIQMLSPSAKTHFKLLRDPFLNDVSGPDDVFQSESQRYVVLAMMQTAMLGGITAVIGESGSGKTTLRKLLMHRIHHAGEKVRVVFPQALDKTKLSTGAICTAIIKDLEPETPLRSSLEGQARQVKEVLQRSAEAGYKHLLLIEEAHDLSIATLKYLKRFWEIETADGFSVSLGIVLVAQPEMRVKLDVSRHPQAREFINRCEIASLDPLQQQVGPYLAHKFARLGVRLQEVFTDDAIDAIRQRWTRVDPATHAVRTNLYPLIVNNTATAAMNRAAELGLPLVTGDLIKEL